MNELIQSAIEWISSELMVLGYMPGEAATFAEGMRPLLENMAASGMDAGEVQELLDATAKAWRAANA